MDNVLLSVNHLEKKYGTQGKYDITALKDIHFQISQGEFVSLVGPSGCGKTSLLKCMDGLMAPTSGAVRLKNKIITRPPKEMVLVFQNYANSLFPWLTVRGNILFALDGKNIGKNEKFEIVRQSLVDVGLDEFAESYPWQLSGGMQQRVAIARGLAYGSEIVLMDEPFASVDAQTRTELEDLLLKVWETYQKTILFVTHDIDEAVYLSDRVVILSERPSVVLDVMKIDLKRPRHQLETRGEAPFIAMRNHIYTTLKSSGISRENKNR